jgi:hypothetical protein
MTLIDKVLKIAAVWATANGHSSTARLSTLVANDGRVLAKLEAGGGATLATLDKFAVFLREPANWPGAVIPAAAADLLAEVGAIATLPDADAA